MMDQQGPLQRALHTHVYQVKPSRIRYVEPSCPACASIDLDRMTGEYAYFWYQRDKKERDFERALRQ